MIRAIAVIGDPVLEQIAREVTREELATPVIQQVIDDLIHTLRSAKGAGLAAPQINESVRIVIVDQPVTVLVNPVVTPVDDVTDTSQEGCLSVPGVLGEVRRPLTVRVQALDRKGKTIDAVWTKFRATVAQHEVDHLNGILFLQRTEILSQARIPNVPMQLPTRMGDNGKRTFTIESPDVVGGSQHITFQFAESGRVVGLRIRPGGAVVTSAQLSNVRFKQRNYPAGTAEQRGARVDGGGRRPATPGSQDAERQAQACRRSGLRCRGEPMTPKKCDKHELQPGEMGDSPRYERAMIESLSCLRCRALAVAANIAYRWNKLWGFDDL